MEISNDIFKLKYNNVKPRQGAVLISEPFAEDSIFKRSAVLLVEHTKEQVVGFILNKQTNIFLSEFYEEFKNQDFPVYIGGPVNSDSVYFIHTIGDKIPESIEIGNGLYWGGNFDIVKLMVAENVISENQIQFFLGYAGWEYEQLKEELSKDFWLVTNASTKLIMKKDHKIWEKLVSKISNKYKIWENFPINPNFN